MPELNRPEVLYWTRCFGKALTEGVVPTGGHYFPEPHELNPVTLAFFKKVVRAAAHECWPYLMFGEMLRPPTLDVPTIAAAYCKFVLTETEHTIDPKQRHEVQDRVVQTAAWRGRDGSLCQVFVNISEEPVGFTTELPGTEAPTHDVYSRRRSRQGGGLPHRGHRCLPRQSSASHAGSPTSTKLAQKNGWAAPFCARRWRMIANCTSCSASSLLLPSFSEP